MVGVGKPLSDGEVDAVGLGVPEEGPGEAGAELGRRVRLGLGLALRGDGAASSPVAGGESLAEAVVEGDASGVGVGLIGGAWVSCGAGGAKSSGGALVAGAEVRGATTPGSSRGTIGACEGRG
ncbi:hypothetical protein ACFVZL_44490, partial [Streptomyces sp. NPDC058320]|uniref:hypothetical protein n=1 Tax=Streptomyces sp. NPDC058320 TaxID=3346444 RepID=UPI0036E3EB50